jgi:hypothetical protein
MAPKKAHPGFNSVRDQIAKRSGLSKDRAAAVLASSSRKASPAAKKANPKLLKVGGTKKGKADPPKRHRGPTKPTEVHVHVHMPMQPGAQTGAMPPGGAMDTLMSGLGSPGTNGGGQY